MLHQQTPAAPSWSKASTPTHSTLCKHNSLNAKYSIQTHQPNWLRSCMLALYQFTMSSTHQRLCVPQERIQDFWMEGAQVMHQELRETASAEGVSPSLMGRGLEWGYAIPKNSFNLLIQNGAYCISSDTWLIVHKSYSNIKRKNNLQLIIIKYLLPIKVLT